MNREIKFRAWDRVTNQMVDLKKITPFALDPALDADGLFLPFDDAYALMQYTGLKDKNGVEIYEGDIVRFNGFCENGDDFIAEIEFKFNLFLGWLLHKDHEVIGNVYENPELLESEGVR